MPVGRVLRQMEIKNESEHIMNHAGEKLEKALVASRNSCNVYGSDRGTDKGPEHNPSPSHGAPHVLPRARLAGTCTLAEQRRGLVREQPGRVW